LRGERGRLRGRFANRSQFGGRGGGRFAIRTQLGVFGEDGVEIFEEFGGWLGEQVEVGRGYTIRIAYETSLTRADENGRE